MISPKNTYVLFIDERLGRTFVLIDELDTMDREVLGEMQDSLWRVSDGNFVEIGGADPASEKVGEVSALIRSPVSLGEVKALHDALIHARGSLRSLVSDLVAGKAIEKQRLQLLESSYCGPACAIDALEVVVRSRKQFDDVAIEAAHLREEVRHLQNHLRVAREERDERIKASKKADEVPESPIKTSQQWAESALDPSRFLDEGIRQRFVNDLAKVFDAFRATILGKPVWLISRLWTDNIENEVSKACGYMPEGYCLTESVADELVAETGGFEGRCWAVSRGTPVRRKERLVELCVKKDDPKQEPK